jgi:hypothetical protein
MGMEVAAFYEMTPRQFFNKLRGFTDKEDELMKAAWERMRFSTTAIINVWLDRKSKIEPHKLIKFPWDAQLPKNVLSTDDFEEIIKNWNK